MHCTFISAASLRAWADLALLNDEQRENLLRQASWIDELYDDDDDDDAPESITIQCIESIDDRTALPSPPYSHASGDSCAQGEKRERERSTSSDIEDRSPTKKPHLRGGMSQMMPRAIHTHEHRVHADGKPDDSSLPGKLIRSEDEPPVENNEDNTGAANFLYEEAYRIETCFKTIFNYEHVERLPLTIDFGRDSNTAFWRNNNPKIGAVFGNGDGVIFKNFALDPDVVRHEISHGFLKRALGFCLSAKRSLESYALWEHFADIMAITVKQFLSRDTSNFLIGENLIYATAGSVKALRALGDPGTAHTYTTTSGIIKSDGCLRHYSELKPAQDRYEKSTIPSFAFVKATIASNKPCWDATSKIWFGAMKSINKSEREITFKEFAVKTISFAEKKEFGIKDIVQQAWKDVGVEV